MDAAGALTVRRQLFEANRAFAERGDAVGYDRMTDESYRSVKNAWRQCANMLGELYSVTADMTAIVVAAAPSLPSTPVTPVEVPSPSGMILFDQGVLAKELAGTVGRAERPTTTTTVVGYVWGQIIPEDSSPPGIVVSPIGFDGERLRFITAGGEHAGAMFAWFYGKEPVDGAHPIELQSLRTTWLLMSQRLAATETETAPRAERRSSEKAGLPSTVNVVRVRKREQRPTDGSRDVEWSHRWLVAGHWRRQWCPSVGAHRPTWIAGYVKGPEEKPLVVKDRVTTWIR